MKLAGQVAIVTGGTGAIGRETAVMLAREGAAVAITGRRSEAAAEVLAELRGHGQEAIFVAVDVTRAEDVQHMVDETLRTFGQVDVLVHCAGTVSWFPVLSLAEEEWDRMMAVNLKGTFLCNRAVAAPMVERRRGSIVNVASALGTQPMPDYAHYAASKAGVVAFGKALALELAPYGVRVNAIAGGLIDTPMMAPRRSRADLVAIGQRIPLGRVGLPADVAKVALFLASDLSDYLTGQTIHVTGGAVMV